MLHLFCFLCTGSTCSLFYIKKFIWTLRLNYFWIVWCNTFKLHWVFVEASQSCYPVKQPPLKSYWLYLVKNLKLKGVKRWPSTCAFTLSNFLFFDSADSNSSRSSCILLSFSSALFCLSCSSWNREYNILAALSSFLGSNSHF